jgi:hypothetical protein
MRSPPGIRCRVDDCEGRSRSVAERNDVSPCEHGNDSETDWELAAKAWDDLAVVSDVAGNRWDLLGA